MGRPSPGGGPGGPGGGRSGGPRGRGGGRPGGRGRGRQQPERDDKGLEEHVVKINRCATVVKGGRRFSFSALVVVGDRQGKVGLGFGKANEVPPSVEKAIQIARSDLSPVALKGSTIPHPVVGVYGAARVRLIPATPGTGVIAGGAVRAVLDSAGVGDVLTKSYGTNNPVNLTKATIQALKKLRTKEQVEALRGVKL